MSAKTEGFGEIPNDRARSTQMCTNRGGKRMDTIDFGALVCSMRKIR